MTYKYYPKSTSNLVGFVAILPDTYTSTKKYPVIFFLHGMGNRGSGTQAELENLVLGAWSDDKTWRFPAPVHKDMQAAVDKYGIIVIVPQTADDWQVSHWKHLESWARPSLSIDWNRVMLAGFSMGAGGALYIAGSSSEVAKLIKCVTALAPTSRTAVWTNLATQGVAVLACCNNGDTTTPKWNTENAVNQINARNPIIKAISIIYPESGHGGEDKTFGLTPVPGSNMNIYEWLLADKQPFPIAAESTALVANAGPDQVITTPVVRLDGRASQNYGDGLNGQWFCVEAPAGIDTASLWGGYIVSDLKLPKPGAYAFELRFKQGGADSMRVEYKSEASTKTVTSIEQVSHRVTFSDGTQEVIVTQIYDVVTKQTTIKTNAGSEYVLSFN